MSADLQATVNEPTGQPHDRQQPPESSNGAEAEEDEEEEEDEEPKLKYAKLTGSLSSIYRNGDSASAFCVAGDKMVMGTHNGNVHVISVPSLSSIRIYKAHSASITSISASPIPPPPSLVRSESGKTETLAPPLLRTNTTANTNSPRSPRPAAQQAAVPNTPNNQIYIATSSLDGHVCVQSLVDPKDVQLRNFARPVNAVALSPDYRNDRTYLSAGLAGQLVLTVGGKIGGKEDANTSGAAAAASGWLGSIGLGSNSGKDTVLHSGEGSISTIRWSLSSKWVVWVNEEGIKIMRSHLRLDSEASEDAWRRIAHAAKPNRKGWEDMGGVWKGRCEWVKEEWLESDDPGGGGGHAESEGPILPNGANGTVKSTASAKRGVKIEKLVVGWGDTAWILHVHEGGSNTKGAKQVGSADIIHKLQFRDCIVSGISLYTPSLLAILAYRTRDDDDKPIANAANDTPRKGRHYRQTSLAPQLRLVDVVSGEEVDLDELPMSRFESLSAQDYHLSTLWMPAPLPSKAEKEQKGALENLFELSGGAYASKMFTSSASVMSRSSSGKEESGRGSFASPRESMQGKGAGSGVTPTPPRKRMEVDAHPFAVEPGLKLFIQSPYDCVLAVKRDLSDRLAWLLEHRKYANAWTVIDEHPEVVDTSTADQRSYSPQPSTPSRQQDGSLADFFADSSSGTTDGLRAHNSAASKEKRRIGDLWLQQLVNAGNWSEAGQVAGKVLGTSSRWEHWVWTFAHADRFDEITPYIPSTSLKPPLPSLVYEVILGHYISTDAQRLQRLLEAWDPQLFDVRSVVNAIETRFRNQEVDEETGEWKILMESLARLYLANGQQREALHYYTRVQNADAAMMLIKDEKLMDAIADDIPGLLMLRVSKEQMRSASPNELAAASEEVTKLLVEEAHRGTIAPATVIRQLERKGLQFQPFLFFYFRELWHGASKEADERPLRRRLEDTRWTEEGHALVEDHADLAIELFAEYDRLLLMAFLRASTVYSYEKAAAICEQRHYVPELVYILSKTGQTKKALFLIIGELGDVSQAIEFAKENPDLWDDLLDYSMDKPRFIRGLLEEVGTAIDPIDLVKRIPEGLEIEGLRDGIAKMIREYEIQFSISEGVAKVFRGEVTMGMDTLRAGQRKAVRFEVVHDLHGSDDVDLAVHDVPTRAEGETLQVSKRKVETKKVKPGHCVGCGESFHEEGRPISKQHRNLCPTLTYRPEKEPLIGFACGHVYHLSCLLQANPDTSDPEEIDRLLCQVSTEDDEGYTGRSVGGKVAHAHIIKNVIKGGCRCCVIPDGA